VAGSGGIAESAFHLELHARISLLPAMKDARAELVRIDSRGQAHPIGAVASQRMRQRQGAYRLLPSPEHVVFMRFTGEDGRRDVQDGAVVRLAGEIVAPGTLCDVLALVAQIGWRGELVVKDGQAQRSAFFDQGNVVGVQTSETDERLGAVLYRYGAIDAAELERVRKKVEEGRRFGEAAVELGVLPQSRVYEYIVKQVEEVVFAMLTVSDGTFFFLDGFDESRLVTRHVVSANALLMDGVTRLDELRYFRAKIPSANYVPLPADGRGSVSPELQTVLDAVDKQRSIEEIGRETGLGEFETTRRVYTLIQSGHVVVHPPRLGGGPEALVATANSALRAAFVAAARESQAGELREALASFAVGAGVYDILFRGAGPDESGALDPEAVARNAVLVASGGDAEQILRQLLHEYVSFALFSVGSVLGKEVEAALGREVSASMDALRPQA